MKLNHGSNTTVSLYVFSQVVLVYNVGIFSYLKNETPINIALPNVLSFSKPMANNCFLGDLHILNTYN